MRHVHMAHKATKWRILGVLAGPAMHPSHETASEVYTILWKGLSFLKFSVLVMMNKHVKNHDAFALN